MTPVLQGMLAEAGSLQAAATRLMQRNDWQLASVRYELADQMSQWCGDCHPPIRDQADPQRLLRYQHMVTGAYRLLDMMLARLVHLAGPETIILLHSDKGTARPAPPASADTPLHMRFRSGHDDRGFLVVAGTDVEQGSPLFAASVLDIAPTLLALLGILVDGLQGRVLLEGFKSGRIGPSSPLPVDRPLPRRPTAEVAATVLADLIVHGECRATESYSDQQLDTEVNLYRALNMLQYGAAEQSLGLLQQLTAMHPEERRYILHRARCHLALNQLDEAAEWADRFVQTGEPDLHSHLLLGRIALLKNETDQALVHFFQAEQIRPNDASSHCQIGDAYQRASKPDQARDAYGRALSLDALSVAAHLGLARVALEEKQYEEACDACLRALESDYRNPDAHFHLAVGLAKLQKIPEAIQAFETCLRLVPGRKPVHEWLAQLYRLTEGGIGKAALHRALSL
jgi:tetratricopeptide (TPR) repeat protein